MPGKLDRRSSRTGQALLGDPSDGIDPYLPANGNIGYNVSRYDLHLEYRVSTNRLAGVATLTATTVSTLSRFSVDLSSSLKVDRITVNGKRPTRYTHRSHKLTITLGTELPAGGAMTIVVKYSGNPRPIRGQWGDVGWEELTEGALVASQPNGAASWFPCDDHPSSKAAYGISITTDSPFMAIANGVLRSKRTKAAQTTWVYEQIEPMASYLATIQIGAYTRKTLSTKPVPIHAVIPPRLRRNLDHDFAKQRLMMEVFVEMFGPYPFPEYSVVVTDDDLEIPIEAQGMSIFGANHCDGTGSSERLVAHELAHQWFGNSLTLSRWKDIWLHEGFACYSEWLWSERSGGPSAEAQARKYYGRLAASSMDLAIGDPGPKYMFDDRVYKRGALTLHALRKRVGDNNFFDLLREWTREHRYSSVTSADFTGLAAKYSPMPLNDLWQHWLDEKPLPAYPVL
ncbi:M1 family metallopeptidase [Williamsia sp.]|uniref:M1 family metallopeptidase n=1 Tax=Williamsia sp. TaxID=1872085 RepID=UPI002F92F51F